MLHEFRTVRQDRGSYRRLFTDDHFDLYLWYRRRWGRLLGFQLVYGTDQDDPHALRWTRRDGYHHEVVDNTDSPGGNKGTPFLVPDGALDHVALADRFLQASSHVPRRIRAFVHGAVLQYGHVADRETRTAPQR